MGSGYLVADAVSMHGGLGRHDRLSPSTSLLDSFHLLGQLGSDLGRRGSGLGRHYPGLVAFVANPHSTALEFGCRRFERQHLWPLSAHAHIVLKWAALSWSCSPCLRVLQARFRSPGPRLGLAACCPPRSGIGQELVAGNRTAALETHPFFIAKRPRFLHKSYCPQINPHSVVAPYLRLSTLKNKLFYSQGVRRYQVLSKHRANMQQPRGHYDFDFSTIGEMPQEVIHMICTHMMSTSITHQQPYFAQLVKVSNVISYARENKIGHGEFDWAEFLLNVDDFDKFTDIMHTEYGSDGSE